MGLAILPVNGYITLLTHTPNMAKKKKPKKPLYEKPTKKRKAHVLPSSKKSRRKSGKQATGKSRQTQRRVKLVAKSRKATKNVRNRVPNNRRKSPKTSKKAQKIQRITQAVKPEGKKVSPPTIEKLKHKDDQGNETRFYGNVLAIHFTVKNFDLKLAQIDALTDKDIQYYIDKNFPLFPRAFQIIIITRMGKEEFTKANKISPPDMAVNLNNIKQVIKATMVDFQDGYLEALEAVGKDDLGDSDWVWNPGNIVEIRIRFFYGG